MKLSAATLTCWDANYGTCRSECLTMIALQSLHCHYWVLFWRTEKLPIIAEMDSDAHDVKMYQLRLL